MSIHGTPMSYDQTISYIQNFRVRFPKETKLCGYVCHKTDTFIDLDMITQLVNNGVLKYDTENYTASMWTVPTLIFA